MFEKILERMTTELTALALSPVPFMFQWNIERMTNFQVTVPPVPLCVSSALHEEDLQFVVECVMRGTENGKNRNRKAATKLSKIMSGISTPLTRSIFSTKFKSVQDWV